MEELKNGEEITINIPFTYTIGEEGFYTGKVLKTIDDCKNEVLAEIEADVLKENEVFLSVENNNSIDFEMMFKSLFLLMMFSGNQSIIETFGPHFEQTVETFDNGDINTAITILNQIAMNFVKVLEIEE